MARTRAAPGEDEVHDQPYLLVPREQLDGELNARIGLGTDLAEVAIADRGGLDAVQSDYYTWNEYNSELLKRRFTTTAIADEYDYFGGGVFAGYDTLAERVDDYRDDVRDKVRQLVSIRERLPLIQEAASVKRQEALAGDAAAEGFEPRIDLHRSRA